MKTIFITGATAGFGKAIAYTFAQHAWRLILNGRRQDRLEALATTSGTSACPTASSPAWR